MIKANKGIRWMPWHQAPMKDVTNCDKLRGAVNKLRSVDFRMRKLTASNVAVSCIEFIDVRGEPGELKHLSTRRKRKKTIDFLSSGERKGNSPNQKLVFGVRTCIII